MGEAGEVLKLEVGPPAKAQQLLERMLFVARNGTGDFQHVNLRIGCNDGCRVAGSGSFVSLVDRLKKRREPRQYGLVRI